MSPICNKIINGARGKNPNRKSNADDTNDDRTTFNGPHFQQQRNRYHQYTTNTKA